MSPVIENILSMKRKASEQAKLALTLTHSPVAFRKCVRIYVLSKYLIEESEYSGDDLEEMINLSVEKSQRLPKGYSSSVDFPSGCDGTTSAVLKKALLLMAAQKDYGIVIDPALTGTLKTTEQLADLILALLQEQE